MCRQVVAGICEHVLDLGLHGLFTVSSFTQLCKPLLCLHLLGCQLLLQLQPLNLAALQLPGELQQMATSSHACLRAEL